TEKLSDTTRWEKLGNSIHWLMVGDTVRVSSGHAGGGVAGQVYRYIGPGNTLLTAEENYADIARWVPQDAGINVSILEEGVAWKLVDGAGKSYTMRFDPVPTGSTASPSAVVGRNSINAVSVGASAALGFSFGGSGKSVSGAGAVAVNTIRGSTDASLRNSNATAEQGDLVIDALSDKAIAATIVSLSVAVGAGSSSGVGASIGISIARNLIGKEGFGVLGEAANATVRALVIDSDIVAGGSLDLRADARQVIDALVISGSAAVAGSSGTGIAASGSGVWAQNEIGTRVQAGVFIATALDAPLSEITATASGTRPSDIRADEVLVQASDRSTIRSVASASTLAIAFGGNTGVALSIGVSLARNVIDGSVEAALDGATVRSAKTVQVLANSDASIRVLSLAASVGAGLSGGTGVGISGAGASALNVILNDTLAHVHDSAIEAGDSITVSALATNRINARVIAASLGVGVGASAGVGASIGVALARNFIGYNPETSSALVNYTGGIDSPTRIKNGQIVRLSSALGLRSNETYQYIGKDDLERKNDKDDKPINLITSQDYSDIKKWKQLIDPTPNQVKAWVSHSSVVKTNQAVATQAFKVSALVDQKIEALVVSGSVAASGGGSFALALSGAGGSTVNRLKSDVGAYVVNTTGAGVDVNGDITVSAKDSSVIDSSVTAVSVAASFGGVGASVAIGVSLAESTIESTIQAVVNKAKLTSRLGALSIDASDLADIDTASTAVAVAFSVSASGVAIAGGGANAINTIKTSTGAWVDYSQEPPATVSPAPGRSTLSAGTDIRVKAQSDSNADTRVKSAAASFGLIAAAASGMVAKNLFSPAVSAYVRATDVTAGGEVWVEANGNRMSRADTLGLAVSSGASVGVSAVETKIDNSEVFAAVDDGSSVRADRLEIHARSNDDLLQKSIAISGGLFSGLGVTSNLDIIGDAKARIGDNTTINVGTLDLSATRDQEFDAQVRNVGVSAVGAAGAGMTRKSTGKALVEVGRQAQVNAGSILVNAINTAPKERYSSEENSLRSFSFKGAGGDVINVEANLQTGARVNVGDGARLTVTGVDEGAALFRIVTLSDILLRDKARIDGIGIAGLLTALDLEQTTISQSTITVGSGAALRNLTGDLELATRTDADVLAASNAFSAAAVSATFAQAQS
ncbi:MAG: hypothetical protein RL458_618, partial [Pseudomonadota bacterium]